MRRGHRILYRGSIMVSPLKPLYLTSMSFSSSSVLGLMASLAACPKDHGKAPRHVA